jgi:hypothetical protein
VANVIESFYHTHTNSFDTPILMPGLTARRLWSDRGTLAGCDWIIVVNLVIKFSVPVQPVAMTVDGAVTKHG